MTPWFHRRTEEDQATERGRSEAAAQAQERAEESRRRVEAGGLPLEAEERLRRLASAEGGPQVFSSDLSVQEFSLLAGFGVRPLTQVMAPRSTTSAGSRCTTTNRPR